jgi:hypothetical protein
MYEFANIYRKSAEEFCAIFTETRFKPSNRWLEAALPHPKNALLFFGGAAVY